MKIYAVRDVLLGHLVYNVIFISFILKLFPDPEIMCHLMHIDQHSVLSWLGSWMSASLSGTRIYQDSYSSATCRVDLARAVRTVEDGTLP